VIFFLEQVHLLAVGRGYLHDSDLARNLLGVVVNDRLPENSPSDREAKKGEIGNELLELSFSLGIGSAHTMFDLVILGRSCFSPFSRYARWHRSNRQTLHHRA
jgi:hypothetical protein